LIHSITFQFRISPTDKLAHRLGWRHPAPYSAIGGHGLEPKLSSNGHPPAKRVEEPVFLIGCARDYDRTMTLLTEFGTKKGDWIGDHEIKAVPLVGADKLYRPREGERLILLCGRVLAGAAPSLPRPVQPRRPQRSLGRCDQKASCMATQPAVSRDRVDQFPAAAIAAGHPGPPSSARECARPLCKVVRLPQPLQGPDAIQIEHHKTSARALDPASTPRKAPCSTLTEAVRAQVPRGGASMIIKPAWMRQKIGKLILTSESCTAMQMAKVARKVQDGAGLTLDVHTRCLWTQTDLTEEPNRLIAARPTSALPNTSVALMCAPLRRRTPPAECENEQQLAYQNAEGSDDAALA
jgi:hypothetical protein